MPKIVFYAVAAILVIAVFPLPYGFYPIVRLVATIAFAWLAYLAYLRKDKTLVWVFAFVALLFNPLIPVYLSREIWFPIDILAALGMLLASKRFSND